MPIIKRLLTACIALLFAGQTTAGGMLHEISGHNISLAELQGKWVFINYWASWCRSCLDEIPELNRFYEENKKNNVVLFAVNYDALPLAMQEKLIKKFGIRYPSLTEDPATPLKLGDIRGVPVTFVFNPKGQLREALYGGQSVNSLNEVIAAN